MPAVRIAVVSERLTVDIELRRRDLPVQNDHIRFRSVSRLVRRIEFVRSLFRQFRTRGVAHELLPAGQFHEHTGERRFVLRDKLDICGIRRITGVHRTLSAVQRSRGVRLVRCYRNRRRFVPAAVGAVELIRPLRCKLRPACVRRKGGTARHLHIAICDSRQTISGDILHILRIRVCSARFYRRSAVERTRGQHTVKRDRYGSRLIPRLVYGIERIRTLRRELRAKGIAFKLGAAPSFGCQQVLKNYAE